MPECFLCAARQAGEAQDRDHLVLLREPNALIMLNRYPYTVGALMVASASHRATILDVDEATLADLMRLVKESIRILDRAMAPKGYNIGINQGAAAGAGLDDHLHIHVVPRWNADTNFMTTVGEARVMSESLAHMYDRLKAAMKE